MPKQNNHQCDCGGVCLRKQGTAQERRNALVTTLGIFVLLTVIGVASRGAVAQSETGGTATPRQFTAQELPAFDGQAGRPAYFAYEGTIYDASNSPLFQEGEHYGHLVGKDLTSALAGAPHGMDVFAATPVVGQLVDSAEAMASTEEKSVYPIIIFGKSITAWTGYFLGLFFLLNFTTCAVMPWRGSRLPWKGSRPGPDKLDEKGWFRFTYPHVYFAWLTIIFGIIHGILAILQSFNIRI